MDQVNINKIAFIARHVMMIKCADCGDIRTIPYIDCGEEPSSTFAEQMLTEGWEPISDTQAICCGCVAERKRQMT